MTPEIGVLIGLVLAVGAVIGVARPLLRSTDGTLTDETALSDLQARREAAYQVLRDLDGDFQVGRLAEDDYRQMRVQALSHAAEVVAQIDAYRAPATPDGRTGSTPSEAPRRTNGKADAYCPRCGAPHEPDDAFCRKCGRALKQ